MPTAPRGRPFCSANDCVPDPLLSCHHTAWTANLGVVWLIFNSTNIQAIECAYKFALEKRLGTTFRVICKTRIRPRPPDGRWAARHSRRRAARGWRQDEEP